MKWYAVWTVSVGLLLVAVPVLPAQKVKERTTLKGHDGPARCVAFTPDGKTLASGGYDQTVRLWAAATGKELGTIEIDSGQVWCLAFAPDGKTLAAGTSGVPDEDGKTLAEPGSVELWDIKTLKKRAALQGYTDETDVVCAAFSPDGKTLASGAAFAFDSPKYPGALKMWDVATHQELFRREGRLGLAVCLAFAPDGKTLATGGADGAVRLWDAATGKEQVRLKGHARVVYFVAFLRDGKALVSADTGGTVILWHLATAKQQATFKVGEYSGQSWALSPDGRTLAAGDMIGGKVALWDLATRKRGATGRADPITVEGVAFGPDGKAMATAGHGGTVKLWDVGRVLERPIKQHDKPDPSQETPPAEIKRLGGKVEVDEAH